MRPVLVTDAAGARAADQAAISGGTPSRALMQRAGAAAAAEIALRFRDELAGGVVVATGAGNNGGDGWVIARALHAVGVNTRVVECAAANTDDARFERALCVACGVSTSSRIDNLLNGGERLVVDALLGTGFTPDRAPGSDIQTAVQHLCALAERGAYIVAIDVPSMLDANTGRGSDAPRCSMTLTFGSFKRGQLVAREKCGEIIVLDIGLGTHAGAAGNAFVATAAWFSQNLPDITVSAHKGSRKKIAIIGGAAGMSGAAILAAQGALRSGAGMVKCVVHERSLRALQEAAPAVLTASWPTSADEFQNTIGSWADALLIGPGLGRENARAIVTLALANFRGPVVLDADALSAFEGDLVTLSNIIGHREALLTPHPLEFGRLAGIDVKGVEQGRFTLPSEIAVKSNACVLLKGVPTVIASLDGKVCVSPEGTPILATGGAGDVLGGIAVTLLAQTGNAFTAAGLAAFAHGTAASRVSPEHTRGFTLSDVLDALPEVWSLRPQVPRPPCLHISRV